MSTYLTRVVIACIAMLGTFMMPSTAAAAPVNDLFANATVLTGAAGTASGTTLGATSEAGEPCSYGCSPSVWYRWTAPSDAPRTVTFGLCSSGFDTTLQAFTGSSVAALTFAGTNNDACGGSDRSELTFTTVAGATYHLRIGGFGGATGAYSLDHPSNVVAGADTVPPVLTVPSAIYATATSASGATVTWTGVSAVDAVDGAITPSCTWANGSVFPLATTTVQCTATDAGGNIATASFPVFVTYSWSNVLAPLNADGDSIYKLGSTVPFKFKLTGYSAAITNATARIYVAKYASSVLGDEAEAASSVPATSGNLFRFADGTYSYNFGTKGLSKGTWRARIDLGDGVLRTVDFSLR